MVEKSSQRLSHGAEAILTTEGKWVSKTRSPKSYRLKELDDTLRKKRTKREYKVLSKAKSLGVPVPDLGGSDDASTFWMRHVEGKRLRDALMDSSASSDVLEVFGRYVSTLHENDIIHGDLTTSNVMYTNEGALVLIDFGLSFFSKKIEDKAVDLHLLKQAFESTHYQDVKTFYAAFKKGYARYARSSEVLEKLEEVERRGRNKH